MKMQNSFFAIAAVCAAALMTGAPANAQDANSKSQSTQAPASHEAGLASANAGASGAAHPQKVSEQELKQQVTKVNKASSFIGMKVKNLQNQELGKVEDLAFDPDSGKIAYAVIGVGGFLGVNDKYLAVPLNALTPAPGEDHLVLKADKQRLQNAPGFSKDNWPPLNTPAWSAAAGFARLSSTNAVGHAGRSGQEQGTASATSGQGHYSGTVTAVEASSRKITVKDGNGEKTFTLDKNAQIQTDKNYRGNLDDLKVGSKVDVSYQTQGDKNVASSVQAHASASNDQH